MAGRILIGTSSWTDPTLVKDGNFYPPDAKTAGSGCGSTPRGSRWSRSTPPTTSRPERNSVLWIERTPADFTFNIKAYSLLTNHPTRPDSLYKDLRRTLPPEELEKRFVYREKLPGRGRGRGVAAVPRRADAAALRGQARCGAVPVPAVVRDQPRRTRPTSRSAPSGCPTTASRSSSATSRG